jgi:hypothetical protein
LLDRSLSFLGLGGLDTDCLDVMFAFNLDYAGNRDAIVAEALLGGSPLSALGGEGFGRWVECQPEVVFALDEDCYLQARLAVESRCDSFQVRTGTFSEEPISVYFTVRRYPRPGEVLQAVAALANLCGICEDFTGRVIVPHVVAPIASAIAAR